VQRDTADVAHARALVVQIEAGERDPVSGAHPRQPPFGDAPSAAASNGSETSYR
jgi:hypothetical protein